MAGHPSGTGRPRVRAARRPHGRYRCGAAGRRGNPRAPERRCHGQSTRRRGGAECMGWWQVVRRHLGRHQQRWFLSVETLYPGRYRVRFFGGDQSYAGEYYPGVPDAADAVESKLHRVRSSRGSTVHSMPPALPGRVTAEATGDPLGNIEVYLIGLSLRSGGVGGPRDSNAADGTYGFPPFGQAIARRFSKSRNGITNRNTTATRRTGTGRLYLP